MPILRQFLQRHNCVPSMSDKGGRCMSECIASLSPMSGSWLCVETMSERVCAPSIPMWLCRLSHFSNQGNPMHCFSTPLSQLRQQREGNCLPRKSKTQRLLFAPIQMRDTTHSMHIQKAIASSSFLHFPCPLSSRHNIPIQPIIIERTGLLQACAFLCLNQCLPLVHTVPLCVLHCKKNSRFWNTQSPIDSLSSLHLFWRSDIPHLHSVFSHSKLFIALLPSMPRVWYGKFRVS